MLLENNVIRIIVDLLFGNFEKHITEMMTFRVDLYLTINR